MTNRKEVHFVNYKSWTGVHSLSFSCRMSVLKTVTSGQAGDQGLKTGKQEHQCECLSYSSAGCALLGQSSGRLPVPHQRQPARPLAAPLTQVCQRYLLLTVKSGAGKLFYLTEIPPFFVLLVSQPVFIGLLLCARSCCKKCGYTAVHTIKEVHIVSGYGYTISSLRGHD